MRIIAASVCCVGMAWIAGCAGVSSSKHVDVRKDVFLDTPVWEGSASELLTPANGTRAPTLPSEVDALRTAPALLGLLQQAKLLDKDTDATVRAAPPPPPRLGGKVLDVTDPLPASLAQDHVIAALLNSARSSLMTARTRSPPQLPSSKLTLGDLQAFIAAVNNTALQPYRGPNPAVSRGAKSPTWQWLFQKYMTTYYSGKFIDRTGAVTSKAALTTTITDNTIAGLEHVFLESVWDWIIIGSHAKAPILYTGTPDKPTFDIDNPSNVPTLVTALESVGLTLPIKGVVEAEQSDNSGLSKVKLCLIRSASGLSGDAAQGTSGALVRAFGGVNLGFALGLGALGKISVGDNDTLTKVIDTFTESLGRRSSEIFASELLYDAEVPPVAKELCSSTS